MTKREPTPRVDFEQVKRMVPIEAVLARYDIELTRRGGTLKGCCPIHNGSNPRQFAVSNGLWRCFGDCDRGGSIIELVAALEKVPERDAAHLIARWFAISSANCSSQYLNERRRSMSGERPSHKVYVVEGEGDSAFWHRAGSAWRHGDHKGINIQIPAGMALSGRVVLREYTEEDAKQDEQQPSAKKRR